MISKKNLIALSGGKDSTALLLWARENLFNDFEIVFCDTNWENVITYSYIFNYLRPKLNLDITVLRSEKYKGFKDLSIKKKRVASAKARFCTEELKIKPTRNYIHDVYEGKVFLYLGIRRDESFNRKNAKFIEFDDTVYGTWVIRPLVTWTVEQVFDLHKKYKIKPNPLYKMGFSRVGCFPCVMANGNDLRQIAARFPEVIDDILELENEVGRSFFGPNAIPYRYRNKIDPESGKRYATADRVFEYITRNQKHQIKLFEQPKCESQYNICE